MTVTLELSDEAVERLRVEAARRGVSVEDVVTQLAESLDRVDESGPTSERATPRFVAMGSSTSGRRAAEADEMLAEGFGQS